MTWKPIDTAPKDARILAFDIENGRYFAFFEYGEWREPNNGDYTSGGYGNDYRRQPTHWHPLPKSPNL